MPSWQKSLIALAVLGLPWHAALAQTAPAPPLAGGTFSWTALAQQNTLLGSIGGLRPLIGQAGFTFNLTETSEVMGNASGGTGQGAAYEGLTTATLQLDTGKALGLDGGTVNVSMLQYHGRNLSADKLDANGSPPGILQTVSGIETAPATRLWEAWYDQSLGDSGANLKLGQQSIDQEFITSAGSALFVNTMTGWPMVPSADMPAGGPAYPLSAPGARIKAQPSGTTTVLAGLFNGNPAGHNADDSHGTAFNTDSGALAIAEVQYALNQPSEGQTVHPGDAPLGLPGTYKLGAWYNTNRFADLRYDTSGLPLAETNGTPRSHAGDYSFYGVMDQTVWSIDPDAGQTLAVFLRLMGAPADRNLVSFSANGGVTLKAPFPGRANDATGLGFGYAQVSPAAAGADRDMLVFVGPPGIVRAAETFAEITYQYQIANWWQLQPDLQYVVNPGGGVIDPAGGSGRIGNETVLGLRTNITF